MKCISLLFLIVFGCFYHGNESQSTVSLTQPSCSQTDLAAVHNALDTMAKALSEEREERVAMAKALSEEKAARQLLQQKVEALEDQISKDRQQVGFSAYINAGWIHPASGETIPFQGIHLNQGAHYNATTSVYTCPVNGTYYFAFSLYTSNFKSGTDYYRGSGTLVQDGERLAQAYCDTINPPNEAIYLQCGQSVLTHCTQGSTVWVRSDYGGNQMYGNSNSKRSTFNGFFIYAD